MLTQLLNDRLTHRNGFIRKGAAALLTIPKWIHSNRVSRGDFAICPPLLANSFPKSGTHLLVQLADGLPDRKNFGIFLASTTSSFQFRERSAQNTCRFIRGFVPGEIVRGHLYFEPQYADELAQRNVVHYFVYRDPRDVVVSEAHYLREMNRWHRLAPYFRKLESIDAAIALSINGFEPPLPGISYPNIAARFSRYQGWLSEPRCMSMRFEDLRSENRDALARQMAMFYASQCSQELDIDACASAMIAKVDPHKSHTFRSGKKAGWEREFSAEHRRMFDDVAGNLLIQLGYEQNHDWATATTNAS